MQSKTNMTLILHAERCTKKKTTLPGLLYFVYPASPKTKVIKKSHVSWKEIFSSAQKFLLLLVCLDKIPLWHCLRGYECLSPGVADLTLLRLSTLLPVPQVGWGSCPKFLSKSPESSGSLCGLPNYCCWHLWLWLPDLHESMEHHTVSSLDFFTSTEYFLLAMKFLLLGLGNSVDHSRE